MHLLKHIFHRLSMNVPWWRESQTHHMDLYIQGPRFRPRYDFKGDPLNFCRSFSMCEHISRQPQHIWDGMSSGNHYRAQACPWDFLHFLPALGTACSSSRAAPVPGHTSYRQEGHSKCLHTMSCLFFLPFSTIPLCQAPSTVIPLLAFCPSCQSREMLHTGAHTAHRDWGSFQSSWPRPKIKWNGEVWVSRYFFFFFLTYFAKYRTVQE